MENSIVLYSVLRSAIVLANLKPAISSTQVALLKLAKFHQVQGLWCSPVCPISSLFLYWICPNAPSPKYRLGCALNFLHPDHHTSTPAEPQSANHNKQQTVVSNDMTVTACEWCKSCDEMCCIYFRTVSQVFKTFKVLRLFIKTISSAQVFTVPKEIGSDVKRP